MLGLGRTQLEEVARDAALLTAPTARADAVYSVTPGAYAPNAPSLDSPEYLLVATKP